MSFSLVHVSDLHFGAWADLAKVEAFEELLPDLEPELIVISGDLTSRARHGEFQRARAFVDLAQRTAPVYQIPGDHDVAWWTRPLIPFGSQAKYHNYHRYFGPQLTPRFEVPGAVVAGVLTSHGVAWRSLTLKPTELGTTGHLTRKEIRRALEVFKRARPCQVRILVLHHNVLPGKSSGRSGLTRWRVAQSRIAETGADLVLCGHDCQERLDLIPDGPLLICAGSLSQCGPPEGESVFYRIVVGPESVEVDAQVWDPEHRNFSRRENSLFPRRSHPDHATIGSAGG